MSRRSTCLHAVHALAQHLREYRLSRSSQKLWTVCQMGSDASALFTVHAGDPNCIHIASAAVTKGSNYSVVVSDEDNFDAVLPLRTVRYIYVSPLKPCFKGAALSFLAWLPSTAGASMTCGASCSCTSAPVMLRFHCDCPGGGHCGRSGAP